MQGQYRLGVDAGGTFTDFVLAGRDGKIRLFKSASTPQDGTRAIAAGLAQMAENWAARSRTSCATAICASMAPPWR